MQYTQRLSKTTVVTLYYSFKVALLCREFNYRHAIVCAFQMFTQNLFKFHIFMSKTATYFFKS
jgi:hypothetical protein